MPLLCEDCSQPTWELLEVQLLVGASVWLLILLVSWGFVLYLFLADWFTRRGQDWWGQAEDVAGWKENLAARTHRRSESLGHTALRFCLGVLSSILLCIRTSLDSITIADWVIEIIICLVFLEDVVEQVVEACLYGFWQATHFVCTRTILESVMMGSVIAVALPAQDGKTKTWASLSYLCAIYSSHTWNKMLVILHVNTRVMRVKIIDLATRTCIAVLFIAMNMLMLERMGDPELLSGVVDSEWNLISSVYYTFSTISTVGFRGLTPNTVLGKIMTMVVVCGGITFCILAARSFSGILVLQSTGGGNLDIPVGHRHVILAGTASIETVKELILELLHTDHALDAEDLHLVFLLPSRGARPLVREFLSRRIYRHLQDRVHMLHGSVMQRQDLLRAHVDTADCIFLVPNMQSVAPRQEDTETIMRLMAVRSVAPTTRVIMLLMKGDSRDLLKDVQGDPTAMVSSRQGTLTLVVADEMKLGLAGKSCQVAGFAPMLCNLVKCIDKTTLEEEDEEVEQLWQEEYKHGLELELYEVPLSDEYGFGECVFFQVVTDVLQRTYGAVYLVGLVEQDLLSKEKKVLVNPGARHPIRDPSIAETSGIFIATDRDAIVQCPAGSPLMGSAAPPPEADSEEKDKRGSKSRSSSNLHRASLLSSRSMMDTRTSGRSFVSSKPSSTGASETEGGGDDESLQQHFLMEEDLDPRLLGMLRGEKRTKLKQLVALVRQRNRALAPTRPPPKLLAMGHHVLLVCTNVPKNEPFTLGTEHFVKPLRQHNANAQQEGGVPVIVLAPRRPADWEKVAGHSDVFFVQGSAHSEFDLDRVNVSGADAVFVCNVGNNLAMNSEHQAWWADAEAIRCARLIENRVQAGKELSVIVQLACEANHSFIPVASDFETMSRKFARCSAARISVMPSATTKSNVFASMPTSKQSMAGNLLANLGLGRTTSFFFGGPTSGSSATTSRTSRSSRRTHVTSEALVVMVDTDAQEKTTIFQRLRDWALLQVFGPVAVDFGSQAQLQYFQSGRYASGQLFVDHVVTAVMANTLYNPSLCDLVEAMINATVTLVKVPRHWVGQPYLEFLVHNFLKKGELALGLMRKTSETSMATGNSYGRTFCRTFSFVYTAPPAIQTVLQATDRVICFSSLTQL